MASVEGKVVLITGAGKGAGRLLAQCFASHGARVAANDISPVNLDELVQQGAGRIRGYAEDIAKKVGVQAVIKQVEDDFGRIDILVNHAAVEPRTSLLEMDEWDWHRVLDVNLTGAFLTMQSVGRMMKEAGSGHIINIVRLPEDAQVQSPAYTASMSGLVALTRLAAVELRPFGIFVNALGRGLAPFEEADAAIPRLLEAAVLYLCASALSGQIVNLEG
jgi:NAD(P)-dependent dehydrogenase (short-subunit alcohol dehydrogenase family)